MSQAQLSRILPLPNEELKQVLEYAATLSKAEAADHFTNLLGDSAQVIDFISSFNSRRTDPKAAPPAPPAPSSSLNTWTANSPSQNPTPGGVPKPNRAQKKKKPPIHTPPPRQVASFAVAPGTAYNKKDNEGFYISSRSGASTPSNANTNTNTPSSTSSAQSKAQQQQPPTKSTATPPPQPTSRPPSSAAGTLVSDLGLPKPKPQKSNPNSRSSTPGPSSKPTPTATKITIAGGTPMHGASTALSDLDQAIRALEITTNPSHASNTAQGIASRRCNCVGARHALLAAAPNCLNCGKVICVKEGMGPCTSCGNPLLSSAEVQDIIRELRAERGREKMAADREMHRRADVAGTPRPFAAARGGDGVTAAEAKALEHRDRLLGYQAQNARRTTVRDEAADFDVSMMGNMWATPEDRAIALKKQQRLMREMEWNALPEYEKRRQVVSIDLVGRKVFKKMAKVERPVSPGGDGSGEDVAPVLREGDGNRGRGGGGGAFRGKGVELEGRKDKSARWRRVQDDLNDNEAVILDGGVYGGSGGGEGKMVGGGDEPACG
ncbi:hypothetical protein B0T17DRAFT_591616 [Bombardia bombarda]|uniref:TRIP4/RQT4 C2HC5-type zinc finger domain-containing protein n=1 Tax=Bombardia bombarda TaxID=252184 RepID=A0AA40C1X9_9PEZI|nr:hypothetical protein B0T17DRAFT_591616 [Bombardia bombarda]